MVQQTTTKTIWYKRVEIGTDGAKLQPKLKRALEARAAANARMMQIRDTAERHGINSHAERHGMLTGQFLSFEAGVQQPLIALTDDDSYDLRAIKPPTNKAGETTEWLDAIVYFACMDDHLMLAPTRSLSSREFETYLMWLLGQAGSLASGTFLVLNNQPSSKAQEKFRNSSVRAVTFGTEVETVATSESETPDDVTYELKPGIARAILDAMPDVLNDLKLSDEINKDNLDIQVTVRVKGPRVLSENGSKLLGAVSRATRHMNPKDYSITLDRVGKIKGDELKLSHPVGVKIVHATGLIDEDDLFQKMADYFKTLVQTNVIST